MKEAFYEKQYANDFFAMKIKIENNNNNEKRKRNL